VLIAAAGLLPPGLPVHFLFIGQDMDQEPMRSLAAASPYRDNIHLIGFRENVLGIVASSDVAVLPAVKREGLPKTVIEAMVHRVTPIVTTTGGNAELVEDGVSGLVVPPGDAPALAQAIERLYRNPDETRRMGEAARLRIGQHFRLEDSVTAHLRLYQEITAGT